MEPAYICGFHLHFAEPRTTSYVCLLQNPQQNKSADKIYVTSMYTRNPRKSCRWSPLTFWNMFNYLSLESGNIQTQNWALSCTQFGLVMKYILRINCTFVSFVFLWLGIWKLFFFVGGENEIAVVSIINYFWAGNFHCSMCLEMFCNPSENKSKLLLQLFLGYNNAGLLIWCALFLRSINAYATI